jgi:hypothetical protein
MSAGKREIGHFPACVILGARNDFQNQKTRIMVVPVVSL